MQIKIIYWIDNSQKTKAKKSHENIFYKIQMSNFYFLLKYIQISAYILYKLKCVVQIPMQNIKKLHFIVNLMQILTCNEKFYENK